MSRYRPTTEEARRAAELLNAQPMAAPPEEGAPQDPRLAEFQESAVGPCIAYVHRTISHDELQAQLRQLARDHGVEDLVDWDEYDFSKEAGHADR